MAWSTRRWPRPSRSKAFVAEALERLVRFNTGLGDAYEQALADKLGAAKARELRLKRDGWGSRSDSSVGCPPP